MKKTILTLLIMLSPVFAFAGDYIYVTSTKSMNLSKKNDRYQQIIDEIDPMPYFPGGQEALSAYLTKNMKYPTAAISNGIQGRVIITFFVEEDGSITNSYVAKSVDPSLDKEALRLINKMPKWIPGKINGKNVRIRYTIPVKFKLNLENNSDQQIFETADQMPSFPGGKEALDSYLSKNTTYPTGTEDICTQGHSIITFVVEKDGSITNAAVLKSLYPALDQEALRVVKSMPKWIPGKTNGQNVRVRYTVPVTFSLQKETQLQ